jgi:2-amino-4-hydroxy-6-hydroxymethyldihydropteridine diphosphokinase
MQFADWEPYYREILDYFGFDKKQDEKAAKLLSTLLSRDDLPMLTSLCNVKNITVCGNAPCLKNELNKIRGSIFAADAAAEVLLDNNVRPDVIFTDLDGATDRFIEMNQIGTIIVVHAHGDNIPLLLYWVPKFPGPIVATTQAEPLPHVYNFGGFTDGDRAVFAADELGASSITIIGFDLNDLNVEPLKRGKLFWAKKLLELIGYEC